MKQLVWGLILLLLILHQDGWFWLDSRLVFGFMPVGMFYHVCLSLAAGLTWYLATRWAWPRDLEVTAPDDEVMSS